MTMREYDWCWIVRSKPWSRCRSKSEVAGQACCCCSRGMARLGCTRGWRPGDARAWGSVSRPRTQLIRASATASGSTSPCRPLVKRRLQSLSSFNAVNQGVFCNFYIIETASRGPLYVPLAVHHFTVQVNSVQPLHCFKIDGFITVECGQQIRPVNAYNVPRYSANTYQGLV